ncbi:hypothetical protein EXU57_19655 [Segetibacter sp. 3557_3]|uniref:hypothetical protein n=1 Tax=Segetibacter sp. 3557_3 TaxID=2547429 RepID=UPI001058F605|nr:hypothetical protein [Segetibacter sp. 3557_3]TDH21417.1 hypothetical protein EXU57_19655 [Segetibacter sp. 3557_3]
MAKDEDFYITYKGKQLRVSPVSNEGNIYFVVHLQPPIIIAESMVGESWFWYEAGKGETPEAAELGALIEDADV